MSVTMPHLSKFFGSVLRTGISRRFLSVSTAFHAKIVEAATDNNQKALNIRWEDGKSGMFPFCWLKDCSPDPRTYHIQPAMKARNLLMTDFDPEVSPTDTTLVTDGSRIEMRWPDGTESSFESEWLRFRNPSDLDQRARRRTAYLTDYQTWGSKEIKERLQRFDYNDVMNDGKALHDWLMSLCVNGLALIVNAPGEGGVVDKIGQRIGMIHRTHFGHVYSVELKEDAGNMGYAHTGELPLHTDFPSLMDNPPVQMLHCVTRSTTGGESVFADGYHVAELLRKEKPEVFKMLSTNSLEYIEDGYDINDEFGKFKYDCMTRHKIINVDENGKFYKTWFGNAMRSWFYDIEPDQILPMYRAMKTFVNYCYEDRNLFKLQLEAGDAVLWANDRLLHARLKFEGPRRLDGCYFNWDFVRSRVRLLRDELDLPENQPSI